MGMEFLKTCNTNAQAIGEFEAIAFQSFVVKRDTTKPFPKLRDRPVSEDLNTIEAEFRQNKTLVIQDAAKSLLWYFRATPPNKADQPPPKLPTIEGYEFQIEQSGVMKASELARPPMRHPNPTTPSSSSPATPTTFRGPLGLNSRMPPGSSQQTQLSENAHDSYAIYELFTSSVIALISYYFVKHHGVVGLNFRSFLWRYPKMQPERSPDDNAILWLTNINVYWTSSGSLVVSLLPVPKPNMDSLDRVTRDDPSTHLIGRCIRVAPNGMLAKIISLEEPSNTAIEDRNPRLQRKRPRTQPKEQSIEKWKRSVIRWLNLKGYRIDNLDRKDAWAKICVAPSNQSSVVASSPTVYSHSREILWPLALCFIYDVPTEGAKAISQISNQSVSNHTDDVLEWFESPNSVGFHDPLDAAQEWFLGKAERDKAQETRRKAIQAEEEASQSKDESVGVYPSSPLYSRTSAYGDLQPVSGVYPTPPDGVPGPVMPAPENASVSSNTLNADRILAQGANHPTINLSAPTDGNIVDTQNPDSTPAETSLPFDQFNTDIEAGNDDLFEDIEEDVFDGNGVTDADFNFFDEPDADDYEMVDVESESKQPTEKEHDEPMSSDPMIKSESQEPEANQGTDLSEAIHPTSNTVDLKTEEKTGDEMLSDQDQNHFDKDENVKPENEEDMSAQREPSQPLSPHLIQQRLLSSPKDGLPKTPQKQLHRDSIFDPISFSRKMSLSDAKYHDGRFSFPIEKYRKGSSIIDTTQKAKAPASLKNVPLLTKLRHAIGVATASKGEIKPSSVDADDSDSNSSSEDGSESEEDGLESAVPASEPSSAGIIAPSKRKFPTDGGATPMSVTSFAESLSVDGQDSIGLQTDDSCLQWFQPSPWDWPLANAPAPIEVPTSTGRNDISLFSPVYSSISDISGSQPETPSDTPDEKPLSGKASISVVQIIQDQIVSATLDVLDEEDSVEKSPEPTISKNESRDPKTNSIIKDLFPKAADCNVVGLASVSDVFPEQPNKAGSRPVPRRPNQQSDGSPGSPGYFIWTIPSPHIRVRRSDTLFDLLPPALSFWETLGLAPCSPPKNVIAFCIYPSSDALRPCLERFLLSVQMAYEGCRLGSHSRVDTLTEFERGLVPCKITGASSKRSAFKALRDTCVQLGKLLSTKHSSMRDKDSNQKIDAFVIYMVNPFQASSALWDICSAFWNLFQVYIQNSTARHDHVPKPDLVLQIVPIKYIASFDAPVILDSIHYINLAREVYDRCPPSAPSEDKTPLSIYSAPSFQLEEAIPRTIQFKLIPEPPHDLMRDNSHMHLGYAISLDGAWITAAWTDNCGKSQAKISYSVGTRPFTEVAKEIWQTTVEICQSRRSTWRIYIAKAGVMEREELEAWVFHVSCPSQLNVFIMLMTVDPTPNLKFTPTTPAAAPPNPSASHLSTNTPGSTPQAGVSPEQHGLTPAATPSENTTDQTNDNDSRLVDITDESWGIILSHRLHNTNSTVEFRPVVISGLLVKRGTTPSTPPPIQPPDPEHGPLIVGVNILWIGAVGSNRVAQSPFPPGSSPDGVSPGSAGFEGRSTTSLVWTTSPQSRGTAENLLREVLSHYRALGLLAKWKGIRGTKHGTIPWHIAVAMRGVKGLSKVGIPNTA